MKRWAWLLLLLPMAAAAQTPSSTTCGNPQQTYYAYNNHFYLCVSGTPSQIDGSGGPPTGAAGGDLSGTYPNPGVAQLKGVPFCTGYTPTNGQAVTLTTASSPNPCYTAATPAGGDTITSPNGTITVGGTPSATTLDVASIVAQTPYTGIAATRGQIPVTVPSGSNTWWMQSSIHWTRSLVPANTLQIIFPNYYIVGTTNVETSAGTTTFKAALEYPVVISNSDSITSNVLTVIAPNSFTVGQQVQLDLFGTNTFLNGQVVTVLSTGLSGSQFEANFTHANVASTTESGLAGIITPCTFGGQATVTVTGVTTAMTDTCNASSIPANSLLLVRDLQQNAAGAMLSTSGLPGHFSKFDSYQFGNGTAQDHVNSGALAAGANTNGTYGFMPLAIIGKTTTPSVCTIGDSRLFANDDTVTDITGDVGEVDRWIGPYFNYTSFGAPSTKASQAITNFTARAQFINTYCTDVIDEYGINDNIATGNNYITAAQNRSILAGMWPALKTYGTTLPSSSTDSQVLTAAANALAGTTAYTGTFPACGSNACVGLSFTVTGFDTSANNGGPWLCSASTTTTLTLANTAGVADVHAGASSDNWSSTINQVALVASNNFNALVRNGIPGEVNYFDVQMAIDPGLTQLWPVSYCLSTGGLLVNNCNLGTTQKFATLDGTHETAVGNTIIKQSGAINPLIITR